MEIIVSVNAFDAAIVLIQRQDYLIKPLYYCIRGRLID